MDDRGSGFHPGFAEHIAVDRLEAILNIQSLDGVGYYAHFQFTFRVFDFANSSAGPFYCFVLFSQVGPSEDREVPFRLGQLATAPGYGLFPAFGLQHQNPSCMVKQKVHGENIPKIASSVYSQLCV